MYLHFVSTFCLNLVWGLSNRLTESVLFQETHLTVFFSVIILVSSFFFGTKGKEENPEKLQLLSTWQCGYAVSRVGAGCRAWRQKVQWMSPAQDQPRHCSHELCWHPRHHCVAQIFTSSPPTHGLAKWEGFLESVLPCKLQPGTHLWWAAK